MSDPAEGRPPGSLLVFFLLTYAVTWPCFIAFGALASAPGSTAHPLAVLRQPVLYLGIFAPSLVALWLTRRAQGRDGVIALLRRLFDWRVAARWYVFAIGYLLAIKLAVALLYRLATGAWPRFGQEPWVVIAVAIVGSTVMGGQAGEEIGWRGYALPRLAARIGLGWGSVVLGIVWALWHLPLFFIPEADTYGQSILVYVLQVTALSVAMAWLYGHAGGSLLLTMLMHSAVNQTSGIVPSAVPGATNPFAPSTSLVAWLTVALLWVCAAFFLMRMPDPRRGPRAGAGAG